jgi:hypothetical protein
MKVMVLVKASKESEAGVLPSEQLLREMGRYNQELTDAGILLAGEGLHPTSKGVRVHFTGNQRTATAGPFPQTNELIAGFWIWQVHSMHEAIDWIKRCPNPTGHESEVEIRPLFTPEDFAPSDPTGQLRAAEDLLRSRIEAHS